MISHNVFSKKEMSQKKPKKKISLRKKLKIVEEASVEESDESNSKNQKQNNYNLVVPDTRKESDIKSKIKALKEKRKSGKWFKLCYVQFIISLRWLAWYLILENLKITLLRVFSFVLENPGFLFSCMTDWEIKTQLLWLKLIDYFLKNLSIIVRGQCYWSLLLSAILCWKRLFTNPPLITISHINIIMNQ